MAVTAFFKTKKKQILKRKLLKKIKAFIIYINNLYNNRGYFNNK
jgi:hypothetical protein